MIYCSQRSVPQKVLLLSGVTHSIHHNCIKHISYVNKRGTLALVLLWESYWWWVSDIFMKLRKWLMAGTGYRILQNSPPPPPPNPRKNGVFVLISNQLFCPFLVDSINSWVWCKGVIKYSYTWNSIAVSCYIYTCIALSCIHSTFMCFCIWTLQ